MDDLEQQNTPSPSLTEAAFGYLKTAGPWMFFLGIFGFVCCGLSLLGGIVAIFADRFITEERLAQTGLIYIVMAVVSFFPSRLLFLTGSKLRSLKTGDSGELLESALKSNASFWKFYGVLSIIMTALVVVALVVVIIIGVAA